MLSSAACCAWQARQLAQPRQVLKAWWLVADVMACVFMLLRSHLMQARHGWQSPSLLQVCRREGQQVNHSRCNVTAILVAELTSPILSCLCNLQIVLPCTSRIGR